MENFTYEVYLAYALLSSGFLGFVVPALFRLYMNKVLSRIPNQTFELQDAVGMCKVRIYDIIKPLIGLNVLLLGFLLALINLLLDVLCGMPLDSGTIRDVIICLLFLLPSVLMLLLFIKGLRKFKESFANLKKVLNA